MIRLLGPTKSLEMRVCFLTSAPLVGELAVCRRLVLCCGGRRCGGEDKKTGGGCLRGAALFRRRIGLSAEVSAAPAGHLIPWFARR